MHTPGTARRATLPLTLALTFALSLGVAGCAAIELFSYELDPDFPPDESATLDLPGMEQPVRVLLDPLGVPHIRAQSETDLLRAVGFMQARARFFQMDTMRRFARGRISELLGEQEVLLGSTVTLDATMRGWGFDQAAENDARTLSPETKALMDAFAEGVNAALARYRPLEYRLLGVDPEPWTPADSFAVGRLTGWSITHNWHQELCRLVLAVHGGVTRATAIYDNEPWPGATSLTPGGESHALLPAVAPEVAALFPPRPYAPAETLDGATAALAPETALGLAFSGASNSWVLGGGRTASGQPLLANDPHLTHFVPSFMYQMHLVGPDGLDVIGVTVAGLPYILIGHNRDVAWGMTAAVADVTDLYVERPNPDDPGQVLGPDGPEPLTTEEVVIKIREGDEFREHRTTLRRTARGPLVNDMYRGLLPEWAPLVSIRGDSSSAAVSIEQLKKGNRARSVAELRAALITIPLPINSVAAADRSGQVALFATGTLPVRTGHRGTFPAPAWLKAYDWVGRVPPEQLPLGLAEGAGYFAHGNNLMYDPHRTEILFQVDSGPSYRRDRIVELIEQTERHTPTSTMHLQNDCVLHRARAITPVMLADLAGLENPTAAEETARRYLAKWDFDAPTDSVAAAVFWTTYRAAYKTGIEDEVDARGLKFLLSQRYFSSAVDLWYRDANNPAWDHRGTAEVETRPEAIRAAFRAAVATLLEEQGESVAAWRWGKLHDLHIKHAFGGKDLLADLVNLPHIETHGGLDSVWKSHFDLGHPKHPFRAMAGPVYRQIIDFADLDHAWWVLDSGSSGWPGSPHYGDQFELWTRSRYAPMVQDWGELERTAEAVLILE